MIALIYDVKTTYWYALICSDIRAQFNLLSSWYVNSL